MPSARTKFGVGLFMASGLVIGLAAVVWLGMSTVFEEGRYYVTFFDESIQGLEVDSAVKYRGVPIGRVDSIDLAPDDRLIRVVMHITSGQELDRDMVAQLKSVGITGTMFIEINVRQPGDEALSPHISFPAKYPVVPSTPSDISQILSGIDNVVEQVKTLDLGGVTERLKVTLDNVNALLDSDTRGRVQAILANMDEMITENRERVGELLDNASALVGPGNRAHVESILKGMDAMLAENREAVGDAVRHMDAAAVKAGVLMDKGQRFVEGGQTKFDQLQKSLLVTTQNLERVSGNLDRLTTTLSNEPSLILFGEPPAPRQVED